MNHSRFGTVYINGFDPVVPDLIGRDTAGTEISLLMAPGWVRLPAFVAFHDRLLRVRVQRQRRLNP